MTIHSDIYHLHADVGPEWPEGFPRHRRRGRGDDIMGVDAERTLQSIHTNFVRLTHRVPMAQFKDAVPGGGCTMSMGVIIPTAS